jgi:uncharacterized membrane protein
MKNRSSRFLLAGIIAAIPLFYAARIYPALPQSIPLHFNYQGEPDRFGDKTELWFPVILLTVMSLGIYLLVSNLSKIDPKKTAGQSPLMNEKIAWVITVFMSAINLIIVHSAKAGNIDLQRMMFPLMGFFFSLLGNYMHSIKPNYFIGFRTPWTLENEDNWRKTHQLVGKIWVPGGIVIALLTLLLPPKAGLIVFLSITLLMVLIPGIYSYLYFAKHKNKS